MKSKLGQNVVVTMPRQDSEQIEAYAGIITGHIPKQVLVTPELKSPDGKIVRKRSETLIQQEVAHVTLFKHCGGTGRAVVVHEDDAKDGEPFYSPVK